MRSLPLLVVSLAAACIVAACGSGGSGSAPSASASTVPSPPPSGAPSAAPSAAPPAASLDGRTFVSTAITGAQLAPGSVVRLTFKDGTLGAGGGCNSMSGGYQLVDGALEVGAMMTTEMACEAPLMAQDTWLAAFLPGAAVTLDGATLTLAKGDVTLTLTDDAVANPDRPLEGTTWVVEGLVAGDAVSSVPQGVTATLTFSDGMVAVASGCNTGGGSATAGDRVIAFGPIALTRMACEAPAMRVEQAVTSVLTGDVAYTIAADTLQLRGAAGGLDLRARP